MIRLASLILAVVVVLGCGSSDDRAAAVQGPQPDNTVEVSNREKLDTSQAAAPIGETKIERQVRERRQILSNGYWEVEQVMEKTPTPRYQANASRWWRFDTDGTYALYEADGTVVHSGNYVYERRGNKQHYVTLNARKQQYMNEYRMYMMPDAIVFVGTEKYSNPGVQMKTNRRDTAPWLAN